jgi:BMFP domain-containing protein YqiC
MSAEKELDPFVAARFRAVLESALVKLALVDCVRSALARTRARPRAPEHPPAHLRMRASISLAKAASS